MSKERKQPEAVRTLLRRLRGILGGRTLASHLSNQYKVYGLSEFSAEVRALVREVESMPTAKTKRGERNRVALHSAVADYFNSNVRVSEV